MGACSPTRMLAIATACLVSVNTPQVVGGHFAFLIMHAILPFARPSQACISKAGVHEVLFSLAIEVRYSYASLSQGTEQLPQSSPKIAMSERSLPCLRLPQSQACAHSIL